MRPARILVLGAGFTGERVARILEAQGHEVIRTNSRSLPLPDVSSLRSLPDAGWHVLHSIPLIGRGESLSDPTPMLLDALAGKVRRLVYLSTTGVYGATRSVDEHTAVSPRTPRECLRVDAERAVVDFDASALVLRPAAIYGPARGAHVSIREGTFRLAGAGDNFVSRVHVDDLAALSAAALLSDVEGAYPVADESPCTSRELAEYCAVLLSVPVPDGVAPEALDESRRADRRVDGSAIFRLLDIKPRYPNYRVGIAACLADEFGK